MPESIHLEDLKIDQRLYDFVNREAIPGTGLERAAFWRGFAALVRRLAPRNAALLATTRSVAVANRRLASTIIPGRILTRRATRRF